ncbi:unnamed protein product [Candidula unifasciata]|uniref:Uncharacterized protein n=1 Tax=Candidula unifasciata TaxID=100452 RepID=A0A8S3Z7P7_9EUPU|nr:unnamed protein product [Candidula unifasciata]
MQQVTMFQSIYLLRKVSKEVFTTHGKRTYQRLVDVQRSAVRGPTDSRSFMSSQRETAMVPKPGLLQTQPLKVTRCFMADIAEEGVGTHKPSAFQKRIMVLAKMYPSIDKVPLRVTRTQLSVAMDKFRVRACIIMVAITFIAAAVVAMIGRRERQQGKSIATMVEARKRS